ncbi:MAG TPA: cyclophilin-like fold protein [Nitrososphaera sp.]
MMLPAGSVSRFKLTIEIANRGSASAVLVRHLAPLTSNAILKGLPLQDRVHRYEDKFVYVETGLVIGAEKQRTQFRRGDVAYLTSNGSICVFLQDATVQPMNPLGMITGSIEVVASSQPGDVMVVRKPSA